MVVAVTQPEDWPPARRGLSARTDRPKIDGSDWPRRVTTGHWTADPAGTALRPLVGDQACRNSWGMFGIPSLAAAAICSKVEQALATYRARPVPLPVAPPEVIDARLDAFFAEILELTSSGRCLLQVDEAIAYACARAEEWMA